MGASNTGRAGKQKKSYMSKIIDKIKEAKEENKNKINNFSQRAASFQFDRNFMSRHQSQHINK